MIESGFHFGAHSIDHPPYAILTLEEQLNQTQKSVAFLAERFNLKYAAFAFPHSDHGVSQQFFNHIYGSDDLDILFGTSGLRCESRPKHFQRFSMERTYNSAARIIAKEYGKAIIKPLLGL